MSISAHEALELLIKGNLRFAADPGKFEGTSTIEERGRLAATQEPMAIILGCSDSRVPVELVFDKGVGDLFVIRVAGNIVIPELVASVEFAAEKFGPRLVVVLGHSQCGAIQGTLGDLKEPREDLSPNLLSILEILRPPLKPLLEADPELDVASLMPRAVRANILASVDRLRHGSEVLRLLARDEGLLIVGAEYSVETGLVDFFHGIPE